MNPDVSTTQAQSPLVSVILCTYNRAHYLKDAIEGVLSQTYTNFEFIIYDDASTDDTEQLIATYIDKRIRYIKGEKNIGITAARNKAHTFTKGEYIAVVDSDDFWNDEEKITKQVAFFLKKEHAEYALVGTFGNSINDKGVFVSPITYATSDKSIRRNMMFRNQFAHSTVMIRKSALTPCNSEGDIYDPTIIIWEDYDLWFRIGKTYKFANIPDYSVTFRFHKKSASSENRTKGLQASWQIIQRYRNDYPNFYIGYLKLCIKRVLLFIS